MTDRDSGPARQEANPGKVVLLGTAAIALGIVALQAGNGNETYSARRLSASPAATAAPHKVSPETATTISPNTTTVPETATTVARRKPNPADIGQRFPFTFIGLNYTGTCEAERIVTIHSLQDEMEIVATKGLSDVGAGPYMITNVLDANYDFNRIRNGIQKKDWAHMKPGDKYTLMAGCILQSPTYGNSDGSTEIWVEQQSSDSTFFFDGKSGRLTGCDPVPVCEQVRPPQIPNR